LIILGCKNQIIKVGKQVFNYKGRCWNLYQNICLRGLFRCRLELNFTPWIRILFMNLIWLRLYLMVYICC